MTSINCKVKRKIHKLTQAGLSQLSGVSVRSIQKLEKGGDVSASIKICIERAFAELAKLPDPAEQQKRMSAIENLCIPKFDILEWVNIRGELVPVVVFKEAQEEK